MYSLFLFDAVGPGLTGGSFLLHLTLARGFRLKHADFLAATLFEDTFLEQPFFARARAARRRSSSRCR
nr:hypothetical protein [Marinicella sp. W31]MDC2875655.1 hypothetical protein [Marinicella sp. W31]